MGIKVVQTEGKSHAVGTQVWDFCEAKVPHLQFRICNLQLFLCQNRWNTAPYGEVAWKATFGAASAFFHGGAILDVDTFVKVF